MGNTVTLRRLEVITFLPIVLSEHKELLNTSFDAYPSIFRLFSFNPFQFNLSANRIPAKKQKEYNLRYLLAKVRTT
jgi:hypothetical protein